MAPSLLILLVFPTVVCAWNYAVHPGIIDHAQGIGKRRRPAWTPLLNGGRCSSRMVSSCGHSRIPPDSGDDAGLADSSGTDWVDDGRDNLPFDVYDAAPPPRKVGVAKLPPLTSSGDTLWHGAKHYKVLRVSSHYKCDACYSHTIRGGALRDAQEIDPGQGAQTRGEGACGRSARLRGQREAAAIVRQSIECRARHGPARCGPSWRYVIFCLIALANASIFAHVVLSLSALALSSELK